MTEQLRRMMESLQAENRILREENLLLTDHAEEALLLRTIAEVAGWSDDPAVLLGEVLERIAVLRDIPLCACGYFQESTVEFPWCYASFSSHEHRARLKVPRTFAQKGGVRNGLVLALPTRGYRFELLDHDFRARSLFLLPFQTHRIEKGFFLFGSDESSRQWSGPQVFLRQAVDMVAARLDRIDLAGELQRINRELDLRVRQRTEELQQSNRELNRLQALLENLINSMPSMLIGLDAEWNIMQWNHEAERISGCPVEQARGKPLRLAFPQLNERLRELGFDLASGQVREYRRLPLSSADGRELLTDMTIYPLCGNEGAVIRVDDVGDRVQLEEIMVEAEKMLSLGGLAAGMAHEINNPLAGILQSLQVVRNRLSPAWRENRQVAAECGLSLDAVLAYLEKRSIFAMLDNATDNGRRAAGIVDNMLNFSRKSESKQAPHDLAELLERTLELLSQDYDLEKGYDFRKIEIRREIEANLPPVCCEEVKIQQVLLNILRNGAQAMGQFPAERPGRFTLKLSRCGKMLQLEIRDNGPGMAPEVRRRIFEPFFTTKGVWGTGLGLSVSYFIITEQHGGELRVKSTPGKGSSFFIRLPIGGS